MGSPSYFGKLVNFTAGARKAALIPFGTFSPNDNLGFIATIPGANALITATSVFSTSQAIDTSSADVISVAMTNNITSLVLNYGGSATIPDGTRVWIRLIQDTTGGRTVALPTNLLIDPTYAIDTRPLRATVLPVMYKSSLSKWVFFEEPFSVPIG